MSWSRTGDPLASTPRPADPAERFDERTQRFGDCLVWIGATNEKGYGHLNVDGVTKRAHRYAWERVNGPIPDGMLIDHTCWNRACVEVAHLRLATLSQNNSYLAGAKRNSTLGIRNVRPEGRKFRVQVQKSRVNHGGIHANLSDAVAEAEALRRELFGDYAGPVHRASERTES